jgi:hypothetical protein
VRIERWLYLLLSWPAIAGAGAWTLPQGELWSKVSYFRQATDEWYIANAEFVDGERSQPGDRRPYRFDGEYDSQAVFLEAFFGVTDRLDLGVQVPFFDQEFADATRDEPPSDSGFSDIRLFAKFNLLQKPLVLTAKAGVKLATGEFLNEDGLIPVGEGQRDYEFVTQMGRSFWPLPLYVNLDAGYRIRTRNDEIERDPGDEWFFNGEVGYNLTPRLLVATKLEALRSDPAIEFGILKNRSQIKRITYLAPTLAYQISPHAAAEIAIRYSLNGRNFPAGHQFVVGVSTKLPLFEFVR